MIDGMKIERRKLFEQVADHLQGQILTGALKPGDVLPPERELQAHFGVGRPAIREALITLQRAGLLEISNGARARIATPTASNIFSGMAPAVQALLSSEVGQRQFQDARLFFETGLARVAARTASDENLAALAAALADNRAAIGDRDAFTATDIAFHYALAQTAQNPIFLALHDQISEWLKEQRVVTLAAPHQDERAYIAHAAIYEGVAARDPDRAEAAMRTHLEQLAAEYWQLRRARDVE